MWLRLEFLRSVPSQQFCFEYLGGFYDHHPKKRCNCLLKLAVETMEKCCSDLQNEDPRKRVTWTPKKSLFPEPIARTFANLRYHIGTKEEKVLKEIIRLPLPLPPVQEVLATGLKGTRRGRKMWGGVRWSQEMLTFRPFKRIFAVFSLVLVTRMGFGDPRRESGGYPACFGGFEGTASKFWRWSPRNDPAN